MTNSPSIQRWDKFWLIRSLADGSLNSSLASRSSHSSQAYFKTGGRQDYAGFLTAWHQSEDYLEVVGTVLRNLDAAPDTTGNVELILDAHKASEQENSSLERATTVASLIGELLWILRINYGKPVKIAIKSNAVSPPSGSLTLRLPVCKIFTEPEATSGAAWKNLPSEHFGWDDLGKTIAWQAPNNHQQQSIPDIERGFKYNLDSSVIGVTLTEFSEFLDAVLGEVVLSFEKEGQEDRPWHPSEILPRAVRDAQDEYSKAVLLLANRILPSYLNTRFSGLPSNSLAFQICLGLTGRPLGTQPQTAAYLFVLGILEFSQSEETLAKRPTTATDFIWNHVDAIKTPVLLHLANERQRQLKRQLDSLTHYQRMYESLNIQVSQITKTMRGLQGQLQEVQNVVSPPGEYWQLSYHHVEPLFNGQRPLKLHGLSCEINVLHQPKYSNRPEDDAQFLNYGGLLVFGHIIRKLFNAPEDQVEPANRVNPELAKAYFEGSLGLLEAAFKERAAAAVAIGRLLTSKCDVPECRNIFSWKTDWSSTSTWSDASGRLIEWIREKTSTANPKEIYSFVDTTLCSPFKKHIRDFLKEGTNARVLVEDLFVYVPLQICRSNGLSKRVVWEPWGIGKNGIIVDFLRSFTDSDHLWSIEHDNALVETNKRWSSKFTLVDKNGQPTPLHEVTDDKHPVPIDYIGLVAAIRQEVVPLIEGIKKHGAYIAPKEGWGKGSVTDRYRSLLINMSSRNNSFGISEEANTLSFFAGPQPYQFIVEVIDMTCIRITSRME